MENPLDGPHGASGSSTDDLANKHGATPAGSGAPVDSEPPDANGRSGRLRDIDVGVVTRSVERIFRTVDGKLSRHIYRKTKAITNSEAVAADYAEEAGMVEEELALISELTTAVAEQYELIGRHTPATLLAITIGGYGLRMAAVLNKLDALEARANKRKEKNDDKAPVGSGAPGGANNPVP